MYERIIGEEASITQLNIELHYIFIFSLLIMTLVRIDRFLTVSLTAAINHPTTSRLVCVASMVS